MHFREIFIVKILILRDLRYLPNVEKQLVYYCIIFACMVSRFSRVQLFVTLWAAALQAPLSMGFSRQAYWSGLPFPSPGIFPTRGPNPRLWCLLRRQAGSSLLGRQGSPIAGHAVEITRLEQLGGPVRGGHGQRGAVPLDYAPGGPWPAALSHQ